MRQASSPESSGTRYHQDLEPVAGIAPVYGWSLLTFEQDDSEGFLRKCFAAQRGGKLIVLDVSSFNFTPTQDRFAWLVRNGFPARPTLKGAWFDSEIDGHIAAEREAQAA